MPRGWSINDDGLWHDWALAEHASTCCDPSTSRGVAINAECRVLLGRGEKEVCMIEIVTMKKQYKTLVEKSHMAPQKVTTSIHAHKTSH
jgi:hypothetical protein